MKKIFPVLIVLTLVLAFSAVSFLPVSFLSINFASAQGFVLSVPCDDGAPNCNFDDFLKLARNIINFLILFSIPAATVAFAWAGFLFLTAQGSESQISKAKGLFWKVLIGFLFVLGGWVIVRTITSVLLKDKSFWDPLAIANVASLERDC